MDNPKFIAVPRDPVGVLILGLDGGPAPEWSDVLEFLHILGGYWPLEVEYEGIEDESCALFYCLTTQENCV